MFLILSIWITLCATGVSSSLAADAFSAKERETILSFGPWPPTVTPDFSNRFSGNPSAIMLGKRLFFDRRLSKDSLLSCADCHQPDQYFADGVALNRGHGKITRHTPSVVNLRWNNWFGWGGEADSLWAQSIRPIVSENEMAATVPMVRIALAADTQTSCLFQSVFSQGSSEMNDEQILVSVGKTLAAYQETLVSDPSAFDRFRDALEADDKSAVADYPDSAKRGLKIFIGEGRCNLCHFGPRFSNGEFADIGVPFFTGKGQIDKGRLGGIQTLKNNPFNLLGIYNDDSSKDNAVRTRHVQRQHRNWGEFKVPSLRSVADTPPYMHNGRVETLDDVINFYSELNEERLHADGEKILRPLNLSENEKADLKAFLQSLSAPVSAYNLEETTTRSCRP